ncbi:MAG: 5-histidylcysteine sulfoxide synthase [Geitlerinemataceae cyanobacterium]
MPRLNRCDRAELLAYFENAWDIEDCLLGSLRSDDAFYLSPDPLRNRLIFYLGHSAVFYINKLIRVGWLDRRIEPHFEILFEIGVDPSTPEELESAMANVQWPEVDRVWAYRRSAREEVARTIRTATLDEASDRPLQDRPLWALMMGIEHQRIHFETSSMLLRQLDADRLRRPEEWGYAPTAGKANNTLVPVAGGRAMLGKPRSSDTYGWDSDYGSREVTVKPFLAGQTPVTNGEFFKFVRDGGYENPEFWGAQPPDSSHPKFWQIERDHVRYRTVFEEIDLPLSWPVEVNHHEAMAYCRWYGERTRLMSEAEWQVASRAASDRSDAANLDLQFGSPSPVGSFERERDGLYDLRGNVWEWLGDDFTGLPGFEPHPLYADYSEPFFKDRHDGQHKVMRGGSWASTGAYASSRNWFRPYFYQHAGFRIARDA